MSAGTKWKKQTAVYENNNKVNKSANKFQRSLAKKWEARQIFQFYCSIRTIFAIDTFLLPWKIRAAGRSS